MSFHGRMGLENFGFILFLLLLIQQGFAFKEFICSNHMLSHLFCLDYCVPRNNPTLYLKEILNNEFFGQKRAVELVENMLEVFQRSTKPISFHFAGENGIGKTFLTKLIGESLYLPGKSGLLAISGVNYQGSQKEEIARHREALFNSIVQQLQQCYSSFIVIDEAQYIHSETLIVLQQFMDEQDHVVKRDGVKVPKGKLLIGFISDFGVEGMSSSMNYEQLEALVANRTKTYWNVDPKQTQLVQYTVPFSTLNAEESENLLRHWLTTEKSLLGNVPVKMEVDDLALSWMRRSAERKFPKENVRALSKWYIQELLPKVRKSIQMKSSPTMKSASSSSPSLSSSYSIQSKSYRVQISFNLLEKQLNILVHEVIPKDSL